MIRFKAAQAKSFFFDRDRVLDAMERTEQRVLSKFGAFVRRTARGSIRAGKKPSKPGTPPKSHTGILKKFIYFVWDPSARSVVIGPARLNGAGKGEAPSLLEHGGTRAVRRTKTIRSGKGRKATERKVQKNERLTYAARPYMGPAYAKERPQLDSLWQNSLKAA